MYNAGLILEGGGMRGVYTAGVLDAFLMQELNSPQLFFIVIATGISLPAANQISPYHLLAFIFADWFSSCFSGSNLFVQVCSSYIYTVNLCLCRTVGIKFFALCRTLDDI